MTLQSFGGYPSLSARHLSLAVFSLYFSWLLAFPFEGQVLYALAASVGVDPRPMISGAVAAQCAGLLLCGFFVKTTAAARKFIVFSIVVAFAVTVLFFLPPSGLWPPCLVLSSFLAGGSVAAWGFFFRASTPPDGRMRTAADALIGSNLLMTLLNVAAVNISPYAGLTLCLLALAGAWLCALHLPTAEAAPAVGSPGGYGRAGIAGPLVFLCFFIAVITFNSGLMYQVINPAFTHLDWLASWYWAIPYIAAIYVMRNLPRTVNRNIFLYAAVSMMGFSFLAFIVLDRSVAAYLLIDTILLGACGIFDLFWWSILGEMLDLSADTAKVFGFGLAANVLGVLVGGMAGRTLNWDGTHHSLLALSVVCVVLVMLPPLGRHLGKLLKTHVFLTVFAELPPDKQRQTLRKQMTLGDLTERESEIAALLVRGKTYKQVASELYVSENTVKTHVKNIYAKYNVQNRNQLLHLMMNSEELPMQ
ncbi:response regulator transcription factor [Anaeroselena agilis]|uniref:Helix-turn-helix transcriptional regulator n=1 Tax=Anaeroselena agilis TaxID=3063788 RepID=A0ABU3P4G6_9FIRM|nr:helix-turn-helix transcriptional regulator [Selenomonadales bacterium 4137-cl]